ncbi:MAG: DUF2336 domain-containing protein [Rhizobiaceae bacterium]|nr:DUF2336 domain-containing protein [Rhizobiaceae bacterium]
MIVEHFLKWIETASASERAAAAAALARAFINGDLSTEDRLAADAALTFLLDDPSVKVRMALAEVLSMSRAAPAHVIGGLAADQPEVAELVLARSPLLTDGDLIDRVRIGESKAQCIIADRPVVSMSVSAAIAETGDASACVILLKNVGADIAELSFKRITERFGGVASVREALIADRRLPAECRHELLMRLGEALMDSPLIRAVFSGERAGRVLKDVWLKASVTLVDRTLTSEFPALVEHLRLHGDLTPRFLLRALAYGKVDFFCAALVALTGQNHERVCSLVTNGTDNALFALLRRAGLPDRTHIVIQAALEMWRDVARGKRVAGAQEASWLMLDKLGDDGSDLAAMLKAVHLEVMRENSRGHALAMRAA